MRIHILFDLNSRVSFPHLSRNAPRAPPCALIAHKARNEDRKVRPCAVMSLTISPGPRASIAERATEKRRKTDTQTRRRYRHIARAAIIAEQRRFVKHMTQRSATRCAQTIDSALARQ